MTELYEDALIEDSEWSAMSIRDKLEFYIKSPLASESDYAARGDFWSDILGINCAGYNSAIDKLVINVMERMTERKFFADSEQDELISYLLCGAGLAEYGTSPRGAWICHNLQDLMPSVIARFKKDWSVD